MKTSKDQQSQLLRNVLLAFCIGGAAAQPLGSLIPYMRQSYGFEYDLSGVLLSCQSVGNLVSVLLAGILPVYLGRRRSILLTSVWMGVAYLIFAGGISAPSVLILACLMTGFARGGTSNFCNTMVSTLPEAQAARGYNLLHGLYSVGALLSPLLLIGCTRLWPESGWHIMAAIIFVLCALQVLLYGRMPLPEEQHSRKIKSVDHSFLKNPAFWSGAAMLFFYISAEYAIVGWLVTYFQDTGRLPAEFSQLMNSLLWLAIFAGRMVGAFLSGKVSKKLLLVVDGIGMLSFLLLMLFSTTTALTVVGLLGVGLFMATIYPTAFAFGSNSIRGNDLGCSLMIFTGSVGGILTPALVGLVAQHMGITVGMWVVAGTVLLLLLAILVSVLRNNQTD